MPAPHPDLPDDWYRPPAEAADGIQSELQRELPRGHLLHGVDVVVVAARAATDDILVQHRSDPERHTVVHLTWVGHTEIDEAYPTVEFDGTFAGFLAMQRRVDGLTPPDGRQGPV